MLSSSSAEWPLWRADQLAGTNADAPTQPTGFAALDAELPGGGWPTRTLTELLLDAPGAGELSLLAPWLAATEAPLLWVAPPLWPYAPALTALGLRPERLTIVEPEKPADAAWAAEQALRTGVLGAVLWWQGHEPVTTAVLRRLHLAAQDGRTPLIALRPSHVCAHSSPAPLRIKLEIPSPGRMAVTVFKRRGPPMTAPLLIDLPGPAPRRPRRAAPVVPKEPTDAVVRPAPARAAA